MKKQFAIIGLGRFGGSVAETLHAKGYEVLAIDKNPNHVQDIARFVTHVIEADSTDENALQEIGIRNFDVVVVAIGEDIQASIMTTLLLKELGVAKVVVKAQNNLHGKVLEKIGADKVVYPERDMGTRLVHSLISPNILEYVELSKDHSIIEITANRFFANHTLLDLDFRVRFGCSVMAIKNQGELIIAPPATYEIREGDLLFVIGNNKDLKKLQEQAYPEDE
ncbi:trk system potassium uptake protein TrkA [Seinonella peptonophila]|uniref:Trk system potassium uptake protein TrkA n=1 Tax=Seinonella peptonophila TaxID=112248 RepID=A0A1M4U698_9BACL|nr:TrkA family potassium uptake protein [Seinonella peptonophila]SHE52140.1 trk system potassium uptake protein TrkA [Seinonella peptonophila]